MPAEPTRRSLVLVTVLVTVAMMLATAPPSVGDTRKGWADLLPAASRVSLTGVIDTADDLRVALETDSLTSSLRGLFAANGGSAVAVPALPAPSADAFEGLELATRSALRMLGTIPKAELGRYIRQVGRSYRGYLEDAASSFPAMPSGPQETQPPIATRPQHPRSFTPPPAVRRAITAAPRATLLLASALDLYLPALRTAAASESSSGEAAAVCDVQDQRPYLCVSSAADQTYTASDEAALIIDQGGNDTYLNSAAGAPFLPGGGQAYLPVSVLIDQAGNDTYTSARAPWAYGLSAFTYQLRVADAGSIAGGVSLLVDDAGDDVHLDTAPPSGGPGMAAMALTQGGTLDGVAALIDRGGNDRYEAALSDGVRDYAALMGQGGGLSFLDPRPQASPVFAGSSEGAVAALIDRGAGDDTYRIDAGSLAGGGPSGQALQGNHALNAQGYVSLGVGVLGDEGGTDEVTAVGAADRTGISRYPDASGSWAAPVASIYAQGYGLGPVFGNTQAPKGFAAVLTGTGNTTYQISVDSTGFAANQLWGQGFAGGDGAGIVDDEGGNDTYRVASTQTYEPTISVTACGPLTDRDCTRAEAVVDTSRLLGTTALYVQAEGGVTGEAVLRDHAGNDRYEATSLATTDVLLDDRLAAPQEAPKLEVTGYGPNLVLGQGHTGLGQSLLLDEAGSDQYEIRNVTRTNADAVSLHATGTPDVVATGSAKGSTRGQGGAEWFIGSTQSAALLDLGGLADRFIGVSDNPVTNAVDPDRAYRWGWNWPSGVQGNGFQGLFVANGTQPRIWSTPAQGVCPTSPGFRGFGEWHFCGQQGTDVDHQVFDGLPAFLAPLPNVWALGRAPNATGSAPSLTVGSETSTAGTAPGVADVAARLVGPGGQPIVGAPVRFDLQYESQGSVVADPLFRVFFNYWEAEGVTDQNGVARTRLPFHFEFMQPGTYSMRLMASYAGADGLYPAHATAPFTLTVP